MGKKGAMQKRSKLYRFSKYLFLAIVVIVLAVLFTWRQIYLAENSKLFQKNIILGKIYGLGLNFLAILFNLDSGNQWDAVSSYIIFYSLTVIIYFVLFAFIISSFFSIYRREYLKKIIVFGGIGYIVGVIRFLLTLKTDFESSYSEISLISQLVQDQMLIFLILPIGYCLLGLLIGLFVSLERKRNMKALFVFLLIIVTAINVLPFSVDTPNQVVHQYITNESQEIWRFQPREMNLHLLGNISQPDIQRDYNLGNDIIDGSR